MLFNHFSCALSSVIYCRRAANKNSVDSKFQHNVRTTVPVLLVFAILKCFRLRECRKNLACQTPTVPPLRVPERAALRKEYRVIGMCCTR